MFFYRNSNLYYPGSSNRRRGCGGLVKFMSSSSLGSVVSPFSIVLISFIIVLSLSSNNSDYFPHKVGIRTVAAFNFLNNGNNNNNDNSFLHLSDTVIENQRTRMKFAWKSQGRNQYDLVDQLRNSGIIKTDIVQRIMEKVDRKNYYRLNNNNANRGTGNDEHNSQQQQQQRKFCYADSALSIGYGQTISAPHMHAYALEEILPTVSEKYYRMIKKKNDNDNDNETTTASSSSSLKILDVGCGSGYLTACFGRYVEEFMNQPIYQDVVSSGTVYGIDVKQDLVDMTKRNIEREDRDLLLLHNDAVTASSEEEEKGSSSSSSRNKNIIELSWGDGWKGLPKDGPFDAIHVGAAAESFPYELINQLKVGGVMIVPVGSQTSPKPQVLYRIDRIKDTNANTTTTNNEAAAFHDDDFQIRTLLGVRYVPLIRTTPPTAGAAIDIN